MKRGGRIEIREGRRTKGSNIERWREKERRWGRGGVDMMAVDRSKSSISHYSTV